jgi:hypothetical protein
MAHGEIRRGPGALAGAEASGDRVCSDGRSRDFTDRFSGAVVELVQRAHPGDLDETRTS